MANPRVRALPLPDGKWFLLIDRAGDKGEDMAALLAQANLNKQVLVFADEVDVEPMPQLSRYPNINPVTYGTSTSSG